MNKPLNKERSVSRPLKVGFVFDDSLDSHDGVAQYVKLLGEWLGENGHQVRYLVGQTKMKSWAGGHVYSLSQNIRVSFNGNRLSIPLPANKRKIQEILKRENFDVLHVQVPFSPFMAQKVISAVGPAAVIDTFHILPANRLSYLGSKLLAVWQRRVLKRFDTVIGVSPPAVEFADDVFGLTAVVLPNVVNLKKYSAGRTRHPEKNAGPPSIVFLGRLVERKGCMQLLQAVDRLAKEGINFHLTIAGDGPERRKLESFVKVNGLDNQVRFLGFIEENTKPNLLASADIACFPALYGESFGIVLIEAMAAGSRVVIGGDNPGYRSVLGGRPELLINPLQTEEFADRLKQFLGNRRQADAADKWLRGQTSSYDVHRVGPELLSIYNLAIAKRREKKHNITHEV